MIAATHTAHAIPTNKTTTLNTEAQSMLLLWCVLNAAISPYHKLTQTFGGASSALQKSAASWQQLGIHHTHITRFSDYKSEGAPSIFTQTCEAFSSGVFDLVFLGDDFYPKQLQDSLSDAPPVLFVKGDKRTLSQAQIAIVGTRKPSASARDVCEQFAGNLASEGFWITSGLAEGIDKHAHIGALKLTKNNTSKVRTIAVLGNGINTCYPKQNQAVYDAIIARGGAVVSELLPDAKPLAHNFPRRNRLVSGLSLATLVVEAAQKSGSLITANLAAEQGKLVFAIPGHIYNQQSKGCHELIREGAILVDSPQQVVDDLNLPKRLHASSQKTTSLQSELNENPLATSALAQTTHTAENTNDDGNSLEQPSLLSSQQAAGRKTTKHEAAGQHIAEQETTNNTAPNKDSTSHVRAAQSNALASAPDDTLALPPHLQQLVNQLDWVGQDLDKLLAATKMDVPTLLGQLMELELLGHVVQQGGLYIRCRA